jgi:hypothetical protein
MIPGFKSKPKKQKGSYEICQEAIEEESQIGITTALEDLSDEDFTLRTVESLEVDGMFTVLISQNIG